MPKPHPDEQVSKPDHPKSSGPTGEQAYNQYGDSCKWKEPHGNDMPKWKELKSDPQYAGRAEEWEKDPIGMLAKREPIKSKEKSVSKDALGNSLGTT